jgi:diguanylate cyclase
LSALSHRFRTIIDLQNEILAAGLDQAAIMHLVASRLPALVPNATGSVVEIRDGGQMVYEAASGSAAMFVGLRLNLDASMSGLCIRTAMAQYSRDTENDDRVDLEACRKVGARSMLCHPLISGDNTAVGVLKVLSNLPDAFGEEDGEAIGLLSSIIAAAMRHASLFEQTFSESRHDTLTKLENRRAFDEVLPLVAEESNAKNSPLTLVMLDLDDFKGVNDTYGHTAGDDMLRRLADAMRFSARVTDRAFRLGGDEFAVLMPRCTEVEAESLVQRVHQTLDDRGITGCTFSYGIAQLERDEDPNALIVRADERMYGMKRRGKGLRQQAIG